MLLRLIIKLYSTYIGHLLAVIHFAVQIAVNKHAASFTFCLKSILQQWKSCNVLLMQELSWKSVWPQNKHQRVVNLCLSEGGKTELAEPSQTAICVKIKRIHWYKEAGESFYMDTIIGKSILCGRWTRQIKTSNMLLSDQEFLIAMDKLHFNNLPFSDSPVLSAFKQSFQHRNRTSISNYFNQCEHEACWWSQMEFNKRSWSQEKEIYPCVE